MPTKILFLGGVLFLVVAGCGTKTGNPAVPIVSGAFNPAGGALAFFQNYAAVVSDFKFCVKRVRLENDNDEPVSGDSNGDITFQPGLIDVSSGEVKEWGRPTLPVGFLLKRIKVKMAKDESVCGVNYSVQFNGVSTSEEVEFEWRFNPSIDLAASSAGVELRLQSFVNSLLAAVDSSTLTAEQLKQIVEDIEESAKKKD